MTTNNSINRPQHTFRNAMTLCTYNEFHSPVHFHRNFEFIYVADGSANITVANESYSLGSGQCILSFPYRLHSLDVPKSSTVWVITFLPDYVKSFYKPMAKKRAIDPVFCLSDETRALIEKKLIKPLGGSAFFSTPSSNTELILKSCLYAICSEFCEKVTVANESREADTIAVNILEYIAENFKDDISLQTAADALGYNYQYVSRTFNSTVGYNFKTVLNQYRFEYALQLLRESDKSITEVAFESGFQSLRTFNRVSYEMFNTSPRKCRSGLDNSPGK